MDKFLSGRKILITRSKEQADVFAKKMKKADAIPYMVPLLTFHKRISEPNRMIFNRLHEFTWVFFTSANGVKFFFEQLNDYNIDISSLNYMKFAVVGRKTESKLHKLGFPVHFIPNEFAGDKMVSEFLEQYASPGKVLLAAGGLSREDIAYQLSEQQVFFQKAVVYDTLINEDVQETLLTYIDQEKLDAYTFTSPSTVKAFIWLTAAAESLQRRIKEEGLCVCIGPTTREAAVKHGFKNILVPEEYTIDGMIETMNRYFHAKGIR
ncbi:uroporphyrinogen-III synthase [Sediminibacillus albus]|uniref:Uroporphyrinogen-III synthase n=1 Tax=Sediminibacillus albus TaxID=407036 RepID=A0A1G9BPD1_9BACI|nr:uroporphyrinogen-III synthase [Sediminibacillus albus]SDK41358.1 uroporphyrinogen-III synthase [Sediminibacillus albus]